MDLEPYLDRIRTELPQLQFRKAHLPKQGMDHVAIILDDEWIVRFPKGAEYAARFPDEVKILDRIHGALTLPVPHYAMVSADSSFGAYRLIRGKEFTPDVCASLPRNTVAAIATELARFLSQLHAIPTADFPPSSVEVIDERKALEDFRALYDQYVAKTITANEREKVARFFRRREQLLHSSARRVFLHGDLFWEHILIRDDFTGLAGIIDFGDRAIGDAALDFGGLWVYGRDFAAAVYDQYTGVKEEKFFERSLLSFQRFGISELMHAVRGEFGTIEEAYPFFRKVIDIGLQ